ncbi:STAS domain-containing protein [Streptomyces roseolilacinus]|uniref:STAS domain-containing protein n=1 Tax=Streptomyces roseolilacinus TaxID=66904 RepID=UPI0038149DF0
MTDPFLTVDQQIHGADRVLVKVAGELDHHTAPRLSRSLEGAPLTPGGVLVLDLSGLTYCDSTGITVLITTYHRTEAAGCSLLLAGLGHDLVRVLQTVGLDRVFTFHPTAQEALDAPRD